MASDPIPIIEVSGTHRQVGHAIGEALRPTIQRLIEEGRSTLPAGISRNALTQTASLCLTHTRSVYPHYVEELEGIADAAAVPFEEVFLSHCEELWEKGMWRGRARGCTDIIDLGQLRAWIGRGRPCETVFTEHTLDRWELPEGWPSP
jgi:hypothetical protein